MSPPRGRRPKAPHVPKEPTATAPVEPLIKLPGPPAPAAPVVYRDNSAAINEVIERFAFTAPMTVDELIPVQEALKAAAPGALVEVVLRGGDVEAVLLGPELGRTRTAVWKIS